MARLTGGGISGPEAWVYEHLVSRWTSERWARRRTRFLRSRLGALGVGSVVSFDVRVLAADRIRIGDHVRINNRCVLDGRGGLAVGDDTLIGFESIILTSTHRADDLDSPVRLQGMADAPVVIGADVWIGCRVVILPGVEIGPRSIVAAGAVVRHTVSPEAIVAGVPARQVGVRGRHTADQRDERG